MRRSLCALLAVPVALATAAPAFADHKDAFDSSKLRKAVTLDGVRQHQAALQGIANAAQGIRASGTPGYDASVDYVVAKLERAGYDVTRQEFEFPFYQELSAAEFERVSPSPRVFQNPDEFTSMTYSGSGSPTANATAVDAAGTTSGCEAADFAGFPAGNIAVIKRGGCTFKIKAINAQNAGAAGAVIFNNTAGPLNGTLGSPGQNIPVIGTLQSIGDELVSQIAAGPVSLRLKTETESETRTTENVIADTKKGDPSRTVVSGAHLDSVIQGPGINDNGSGSATILEIAEQFAAKKVKPNNRMRFAWWGAEELGLLGSTHYVNTLPQEELDKVLLNLNFDMVGSPNYVRFVYDGDNSAFPVGPGAAAGPDGSGQIEAVFASYFANQELESDPTPFSGRSDYGPFIAKGVPAGGLFTGAEGIKTERQAQIYGGTAGLAYDPCYHQACDTSANYNASGLSEMSDAATHAAYTYSQTKEAVTNGGPLRKGHNGTPVADDDDGGTQGGGLRDDHDHAVASRKTRTSKAKARRSVKRLSHYGSQARR
ncbi:MAG: M20/M25/M40 family metallo-hydrolase [Solirubrobacteraceae bacterium]